MNDDQNNRLPDWVECIRLGDWAAAENYLRNRIISQAGPQYQAMKELEDLQAITRSRGVENKPKISQEAFERTQADQKKHGLTNQQAINRFAEVLDEEITQDYFAQRKEQEKRNKGL